MLSSSEMGAGLLILPLLEAVVLLSFKEGLNRMPAVKVREAEPFENALRRFKKQCEKSGVLRFASASIMRNRA